MGLGARALEVGMLATFPMGPVARRVGEAVGCLWLCVHLYLRANQLTLSLLLLEAAGGAVRPEWRLRKGQAWLPRLRGCSTLRPLLLDCSGLEPKRLAFGSFASWIISSLLGLDGSVP